nr:Chain A, Pab polC intein [Pyrococcus abyssi GE5]
CFPGDTRILVQIDGVPQKITLRELYELFEDERYENMVYVRKKPKREIKVYSIDLETGKVVLTDIEDVIKAPATDHLIRFELEDGRSFETTVDHPVLVYENGRFIEKRAFEVKEGDKVLVSELELVEQSSSSQDNPKNENLGSPEHDQLLEIKNIKYVRANDDFVFSLNAKKYHNVIINENIVTHQ